MQSTRIPLDRLTWARWRRVVADVMRSEVGGRVKLMFGALLVLLLAINGLNVVNSYVGRDFMTAIEHRSMSGFASMAALYIGVFAASTVTAVIYRFTEERLGLLWRNWMTRSLVDYYLHDAAYYRLRERAEIQNPDQRIADDVRTFTATTLSLLLVWLNGTFTILAFSGVLWSISPPLFAVAVGYAALGSGLTLVFGRPLLWLNYDQSDREASFRAELVHLRENAESVAFLRREDRIRERLFARVEALVGNLKRIIAVNRNLGFFTTGYDYMIQLIPILIVAPLFIRGQVEFGVISQSAMAFSHLIGAFSLVVTQFQQISSYAVVMARLSALGEGVERLETVGARIVIDESGEELEYQELSLRSPHDGRMLVASLSARLAAGTCTLVSGDADASIALFRATAGLWDSGEGRIVRPPSDAILFLTERPYLPPGTLRQALVRSGREQDVADARILDALRELGMAAALEKARGLNVERDWNELLSLGEQQMLSFARLALAAPSYAVLDRPETVLGAESVRQALDFLTEQAITVVTFSSEPALADRHDARIALAADGSWSFEPLHPAKTM
ncbi:MAG TPA: SbmA/BacA-like family transporter [Myxococcota bacterium]|nr:SbmA/BacA-like family transporter [Myxococcota bacterium]